MINKKRTPKKKLAYKLLENCATILTQSLFLPLFAFFHHLMLPVHIYVGWWRMGIFVSHWNCINEFTVAFY